MRRADEAAHCWMRRTAGSRDVWWLRVVGVIAFAVLLGSGLVAWRRQGATAGRAYMVALFAAGFVLLAVGVYAVVVTR